MSRKQQLKKPFKLGFPKTRELTQRKGKGHEQRRHGGPMKDRRAARRNGRGWDEEEA